jgi:uncharacterized phage protein gp47/JayE
MVTIRSVNEIILNLIDFYRLAQPDLDCKPGTVARDLFVDAPASQLALLYDELSSVSNQQSFRLVVGSDLDKLAKNFGLSRKQSTPATGVGLLTFSAINSVININKGDVVIANNGFSYAVSTGISVTPTASNFYRSVAAKFRDQLDTVGISDEFAVEVTLVATTPGTAGNIGVYALSRTGIPGVSNVTNINAFRGGTDQENDATFRNRVLSSFSGSSVGTVLGYLNTALGTTGVQDAAVIEPGNPLMTRDGTTVTTASDGAKTIVSEGSGGKVDIVVLGSNLVENSDTFIYRDKSNNNNPASAKNNVVLGQIAADANKTINRKRIDDIKNGQLPAQPVENLIQVTGSVSGSNFVPKTVDSFGRVSGNYELIKDTGVYGGSPWGFDTFHWISDRISDFGEDRIKGQLNGQDAVTFTDVLDIPQIQQNLPITNENSIVTTDRSIIQLLHTPATSVTRVFNVNTGERYIVASQNVDGSGSTNLTGRIKISGNTLPSPSDVLQVDYSWIVNYDRYSDYDGLSGTSNPRTVTDSVDWGYASVVRNERIIFTTTAGNNFFQGTSALPVANVITADKFTEVDGYVQLVTSGIFVNRLSVVLPHLAVATTTVDSVNLKNSNVEIYNTAQANGTFSNTTEVVGINILYITTIILPTDTTAKAGDAVSAVLNSVDVFSSSSTAGSSSGTQITIPSSLIDGYPATSLTLNVTYISSVSDLLSTSTTQLSASRGGNGFLLQNNNGFNNFSVVNTSRRENQIVQRNLSLQYFIDISISSNDFLLLPEQVISVVRLTDGAELWNSSNPGTISTNNAGNYQLIFSGYNSPTLGDRVLIIYYATDVRRFQPFDYANTLIKTRVDRLAIDGGTGKFTLPLNSFVNQASGLKFLVVEPNTDITLFSVTDGYLTANLDGTANIGSLSVNFSTLADLTAKKVKIYDATNPNNNGTYDISAYVLATNKITITNVLNNITVDQVCVVRVVDGQEVWGYSGTIDPTNNRLLFPAPSFAQANDLVFVMFFNYKVLKKSPTKLSATITDQVVNTGVITASGTTLGEAMDVVFTATNTGLKLNLAEALRKALGLSSTTSIPSNIKLAKLIKAEKVITASVTDDTVLEVLTTYDTKNTTIQNNLLFPDEMLNNYSLQNLDFILPSTQNNTLDVETHNIPKLGDKIRVTFYYTVDNDIENLAYTRNGVLYTNKRFALINKVYISSGFKASQSTKFTVTSFTQPSLGARYKVFYDYLAPKQNERIVVRYNYNKLVTDVTFNVEDTRPINADVIVREAKLVLLDLTMNVVIADDFKSSTTTVLQNLKDKLSAAMTTTSLGQVVDAPTLINVAQAVSGIARARILYFNKTGGIGQVLKVQAQEDEYFSPNNITINTETR